MFDYTAFWLIAGGQLILALVVFQGLGIKTLRKAMPTRTRDKLQLLLMVGGVAFAVTGYHRTLTPPSPGPTQLGSTIIGWLDSVKLKHEMLAPSSKTLFRTQVIYPSSHVATIMVTKDEATFIRIVADFGFSGEIDPEFKILSNDQRALLLSNLRIVLLSTRVSYRNVEYPLNNVVIERIVPITPDLTAFRFTEEVLEINKALILMQETVKRTLIPLPQFGALP